jgi:hypothetical protein
MRQLFIHRKGEAFLGHDGLAVDGLADEFQKIFPDISPKYIDPLSLLAGIAARRALEGSIPPPGSATARDFAVILGSGFGAIDSTVEFDAQALLKGPNTVNPMDFPNTVANAAGSRIGIWMQLKGPNVTLTNGETSFIDAVGFAWDGYRSGLFQHCLVGAAEKVPNFLKPWVDPQGSTVNWKEGACFLMASGEREGDPLLEVLDHFVLQLKPDLSFPAGFLGRLERMWEGAEWLGFPEGTAVESRIPSGLTRWSPDPSVRELGLSGSGALDRFLSVAPSCGVIGVFSKPERKLSLIKVKKEKRSG